MRHSSPIKTRRRSQTLLAQKALLVAAASKKTTTTVASSSCMTKPKPLPFARLTTSKVPSSTGGGARSTATTTSPSSPLNPSGATPSSPKASGGYSALICQICKKEYANNSTLRRHLKIHAYASTSTATRKVCTPPPPPSGASESTTGGHNSALSSIPGSDTSNHLDVITMSSTLAAVNTHLISSFWPYRDLPAPSTIMNSATSMGQVHLQSHLAAAAAAAVGGVVTPGYNPGSDPTIKKPECVGCNKPFARRDTVILHIKNQKRKWDLLCAMLPALSTSSSGNSGNVDQGVGSGAVSDGDDDEDDDGGDDNGDDDDEVTMMNPNGRQQTQINARQRRTPGLTRTAMGTKLVESTQRKNVRQRRAHPFRVAEKLWQSTLQRKKIHFGAYKKPVSTTTTARSATASTQRLRGHKSRQSMYGGDDEYEGEEFVNHVQQQQQQNRGKGGDMDVEMMRVLIEEDNNDENENSEDGDGWPSQEALDGMDNQTKLNWMMKMAVEPPCWSERKVRLFGAYGMVEETVLQ
ncbi:hypothetical protein BGZ95_000536 [Linnemannia exigua]|uniref:C2H2-type domain-containing protein n=1 Tax=Linnemannia exigua TaxID=604196 RepID=A0AAD4DNK0_9FUNG|nr:hypothetical protein BGZ95_000536 [Linnemannia exigua]